MAITTEITPPAPAPSELDALRQSAILASLAGFPFLLVYSVAWFAAGGLSFLLPAELAPWAYLLGGIPAAPIAIALEKKLGYLHIAGPDPLLPLTLQVLFVQIVSIPAVMIVWDLAPNYVPVAFAAVVGGHFLPFQWIYRTKLYGILGVTVSGGAYVLGAIAGQESIHYTGFYVGATLLIGAFIARSHAKAVWQASGRAETGGAAEVIGARQG